MNELEWQLLEDKAPLDSIRYRMTTQLRKGDRVRLRPRPGGDVMDLALDGKIAVIESLEQDYEGSVHVSVVLDDDPGSDIGHMRQPGHRFFFRVRTKSRRSPRRNSSRMSANSSGRNRQRVLRRRRFRRGSCRSPRRPWTSRRRSGRSTSGSAVTIWLMRSPAADTTRQYWWTRPHVEALRATSTSCRPNAGRHLRNPLPPMRTR